MTELPIEDRALAERISEWALSRTASGRLHRAFHFELTHTTDKGREPVCSGELCMDSDSIDRIGDGINDKIAIIARDFVAAATSVCRMFSRTQMFYVGAIDSVEPGAMPFDQLPFDMNPPPGSKGGFAEVEGPDARGNNAFMLRLVEQADARAKDSAARYERYIEKTIDKVIPQLLVRNEFLETERDRLSNQLQSAEDRKTEREVNAQEKYFKIQREERWWRMAEQEMPKLLDKFGAGPLSQFIKSFKKEEIMLLLQVLEPAKRELLLQALDAHLGLRLVGRDEAAAAAAAAQQTQQTAIVCESPDAAKPADEIKIKEKKA